MEKQDKKYNCGIALSGGGARGFAHVGALRAFDEFGFKPDILSGVSAGSVAAVLYSAGVPPEKILSMFADKKLRTITEWNFRGDSFFHLDKFGEMIKKAVTPYTRLEELPIPTYIGATDFSKGIPVEFHTGDIAEVVMASCCIPIVFKPIVIDGIPYVDGGVLRNLPAWILRDKCEELIGVNCSPLLHHTCKESILDIALRTFMLMERSNQAEDIAMCDLHVEMPEIANYQVFNLKEIRQVYISGYSSTRRAIKNYINKKNKIQK